MRETTLEQAQKAEQILCKEYEEPYRVLPAQGAQLVVAKADGSMICTVAPGARKGEKPRDWKEIRLAAAQAIGQTQLIYAATFDGVAEVGRRWGHCARRAGRGINSPTRLAHWIRRSGIGVPTETMPP